MAFPGVVLLRGLSAGYLSLIVLLPIAALVWKSMGGGWSQFWQTVTSPYIVNSVELTLAISAIVTAINIVTGTIIAWVLVRDSFWGKAIVNSLIDLPFALPTIVAGLTLLLLYGNSSPVGVNIAYTDVGVAVALLFVTLPFVARAVQPVLISVDRDMEEAAAVLGAKPLTIFRRIVLPNLLPALLSGAGLAFARALGEFGSLVLIAVNIPVASLQVYQFYEAGELQQAAALSVVLLFLSLVILTLFTFLSRRFAAHDR
jgi:sulfate transport system permease protein